MEDESSPAVDLDNGEPLAVLRLQRRVAGDVDLFELEAELVAQRVQLRAGALAEVAARGVVEADAPDLETLPRDRGLGS
jgi:hypothetical protein